MERIVSPSSPLSLAPPLPIDEVLPLILRRLSETTRLILEAPPGAGKTTRVPLALLGSPWLNGRILMLEPRRIAARAAARQMARLLREEAGRTIGYRTALDSRESAESRILVVTEGVLTRMLQADPSLEGVGCLIFDEFHERSLHADLGLALSLDCQESLRTDLRLLVMSATLDGDALSGLLNGCPRIQAEGKRYPVAVRYLPPASGRQREDQVVPAVIEALREEEGGLLVFLPGAAEIRRAASRLEAFLSSGAAGPELAGVVVRPLYGELPSSVQDAAVAPAAAGERKVVLATSIAETSLTIDGVRIVIDAGLSRRQSFAPALGMSRLVTEPVSRASADQRCGRAGRMEAGLCLRLWAQSAPLLARSRPEILDSDLASLCLELAVWGFPAVEGSAEALRWLDPPPPAALAQAGELLRLLGALDASGHAVSRGRAMAEFPLHPRLAHMVLEGKAMGRGLLACALAALFSERDPVRASLAQGEADDFFGLHGSADVSLRLSALLEGEQEHGMQAGTRDLMRRLRERMRRIAFKAGIDPRRNRQDPEEAGPLLALAWPERVAMRRGPGSYLMANGCGAKLSPGDPLGAQPFLAVALASGASGAPGGADARIHLAAPLCLEDMEGLFAERIRKEKRLVWDAARQAVSARELRRLDALILEERPWSDPPAEDVRALLLEALAREGIQQLPWSLDLLELRRRVAFARSLPWEKTAEAEPGGWPDLSDAALAASLPVWLGPFLEGIDRVSRISTLMLAEALSALLPWPLARNIETLAPSHMAVPSGFSYRLDYSDASYPAGPVLAVKLQELFGLEKTPALCEGRVPVLLHLLSPAGRPVQITCDLSGFWQNGYAAVRAELRGRYPKHPWPEDPLRATATRRTKKHLS